MSGGIDRIFPEPPHEIRGATQADQDWIDETIEAGATCCHWAIKPRPQNLDSKDRLERPRIAVSPLVAAPKKKKRWWQRRTTPTS